MNPGTKLGPYEIVAPIGAGGMGEVYRTTDLRLGQPVALKFLPEETARDPKTLVRFRNEVRIARQVAHPNVCRVYDIGEPHRALQASAGERPGDHGRGLAGWTGHLEFAEATQLAQRAVGRGGEHEIFRLGRRAGGLRAR